MIRSMSLERRLRDCGAVLLLLSGLLAVAAPAWSTPRRLALVIGNGRYAERPLKNPGNDAGASGKTSKNSKAKPPAKTPDPPSPPPKKGFDPNDDGGAQKSIAPEREVCAAGQLLKIDEDTRKITVRTADKATAVLSYTGKTVVQQGSEPGSLSDLEIGMLVTVYCASNGPKDVAVRIRIDRP